MKILLLCRREKSVKNKDSHPASSVIVANERLKILKLKMYFVLGWFNYVYVEIIEW